MNDKHPSEPSRTWFEKNGGLLMVGGVVAFIVLIVLAKHLFA